MSHNNIGARIKLARETVQLSPASLCTKSQMSSARLTQLEKGHRFPSREEWKELSRHISLGPYPARCKLPAPQERWAADLPRSSTPERSLTVRLASARATFETEFERLELVVQSRKDFRACREFLESTALDSGDEAFFYLRLLAEGALPCAFSPLRAGYRTFPVIDSDTRRVVGDVRRPCLELIDEQQESLIFPQVPLLVANRIFRLDALVCARCPRQRIWIDLEIDGPGHDFTQDRRRELQLRMPTLRVGRSQLSEPNFIANLVRLISEIRTERRVS